MHELQLSQVQLDEMWLLLGKRDMHQPEQRKTRWLWSAIDSDTKLWLGYLIADRSLEAAQVFVHQLSELLAEGCVPLFLCRVAAGRCRPEAPSEPAVRVYP